MDDDRLNKEFSYTLVFWLYFNYLFLYLLEIPDDILYFDVIIYTKWYTALTTKQADLLYHKAVILN